MQMPRYLRSLPVILATGLATAAAADAAEKSQHTCRSGDVVRRVVIEVGDLGTGLPCEVVYWKDTETPGVRRVLWNARTDTAFCESKAAGLVKKLGTSGWQCDGADDAVPSEQAALQAQPAEAQPAVQQRDDPALSTAVPALDAAALDKALPRVEPAAAAPLPAPTATTPVSPVATITPEPQTQTAALTPQAPLPVQATEQLQAVIRQNLDSLNKSVDGDFVAEVGQFGDLNGDGQDDAVVFFNYESSTADFTQFVAAYVLDDDGYHLAATKPIGAEERAIEKVEVESIVNGLIQLKLHLNDASQTENRRAAMTLRDGRLVEIE